MCHQLVFATPMPCPEIPLSVPDAQGGAMWVMRKQLDAGTNWPLTALEGRGQFHYQAGVLACGCGFAHLSPLPDEADANQAGPLEYHQQLVAYLRPIVAELGRLPLYSYWDGDYNLPVASEHVIALDELLAAGFRFGDCALYWISPFPASSGLSAPEIGP